MGALQHLAAAVLLEKEKIDLVLDLIEFAERLAKLALAS